MSVGKCTFVPVTKFLFLFLFLLTTDSYGQVEDLYPNVLRDAPGVTKCIVTRNGKDTTEIHYFDTKGRDTAIAFFLKNKVNQRDEFRYNNDGLIQSFSHYGGDKFNGHSSEWDVDLPVSKKEYVYKSKKLVTVNEANYVSADITVFYKHILSYRADGKLVKKVSITLPDEDVAYGFNDSKGKYHQQDADTTIFKCSYKGNAMTINTYSWGMLLNTEKKVFSPKGLLLESKFKDVTGKVTETKTYKYDKAGRMTEEKLARLVRVSKTSISYANNGAVIGKQYFTNDKLKSKVRYEYIK